jgi:copper(I)-binding protein
MPQRPSTPRKGAGRVAAAAPALLDRLRIMAFQAIRFLRTLSSFLRLPGPNGGPRAPGRLPPGEPAGTDRTLAMTLAPRRLLLAAIPLALATLAAPYPALAQAPAPTGGIAIEAPWARAAIRGGTGGAFLTIRNTGGVADRLVSVSSPLPRATELHTTLRDGDVMRMQPVQAVEVPAGGSVTLRPGGLHIMLIGLSQAMRPGETVPLTLTFERAGAVPVQVPVQSAGSSGPAQPPHSHR